MTKSSFHLKIKRVYTPSHTDVIYKNKLDEKKCTLLHKLTHLYEHYGDRELGDTDGEVVNCHQIIS